MIDLKSVPCLRAHFEEIEAGESNRSQGVTPAADAAEQAVQAYPLKALTLQNGQYRVTNSEK